MAGDARNGIAETTGWASSGPGTGTRMSARPRAATRYRGSVPLYLQVARTLAEEITRGLHPAGLPLPSEHQLTALFGVSRVTVRAALAELGRRG